MEFLVANFDDSTALADLTTLFRGFGEVRENEMCAIADLALLQSAPKPPITRVGGMLTGLWRRSKFSG